MNINIEYLDLLDDDIPKELYRPKYRIDNKLFIDEKVTTNSSTTLSNIKKINFFIGANNSGKSRFLRGLIKLNKERIFYTKEAKSLLKRVEDINKLYSILKDSGALDPEVFKSNLNFYEKPNFFNDSLNGILNYKGNYRHYSGLLIKFRKEAIENGTLFTISGLENFVRNFLIFNSEIKYSIENTPVKKTYIPVLRYLNKNGLLEEKVYLETLEEQYNIKENIYTGLSFFDELGKIIRSENRKDRIIKRNFENFLSVTFFDEKDVEITPGSSGKIRLLIDEPDMNLYDFGDGVQSLILLLFPIFIAGEKEWVFIEEPETHLHPGYQRIFLDTILNNEYIKRKNLRLFFTTHSNHFLDQSLTKEDVSIFQFKKINSEEIDIKTNVKPSKETLDLLGVTSSSVLIANSSIWVEGPTDRKYISKWLKTYKESSLKEDIDYAFFEYGGNLIAHYLFDKDFEDSEEIVREKIKSFALSNHIYLLADNDNPAEDSAKAKRRAELEKLSEESNNFIYQNTEVKEIENLLPVQILKSFMSELVKKEYSEIIKGIGFQRDDYKDVGLGSFFEEILIDNKIPKKDLKKFRADSGTLKPEYKLKLCDFVINEDHEYEDFVKDNKILKGIIIEDLYNFIKAKN